MARIERDDHRSPGQEVDLLHPDREAYEVEQDIKNFKSKIGKVDEYLRFVDNPALVNAIHIIVDTVNDLGDRVATLQAREAERTGRHLREIMRENKPEMTPSRPRSDRDVEPGFGLTGGFAPKK
jgi:hypothetical protein